MLLSALYFATAYQTAARGDVLSEITETDVVEDEAFGDSDDSNLPREAKTTQPDPRQAPQLRGVISRATLALYAARWTTVFLL